jgi:O-methyltransferase
VDAAARYLDLMKRVLTRSGFQDGWIDSWSRRIRDLRADNWVRFVLVPTQRLLARRGYRLVEATFTLDAQVIREEGRDVPATAETMIGPKRLDNVQYCVETVLRDEIPGDLIEAGVWRGGATIFMRAVLAAHQVTDRTVWVADSFQGLPEPDAARYPADEGSTLDKLAVSADEVRANFGKYHLLDEQVRFLEGWFADTLPTAPIDRLAVVRLDADMYGSTWEAITVLYPKLSPGGFLIVDDFALDGCRRAIEDYREREGIDEPIKVVDWTGIYWRKHQGRG